MICHRYENRKLNIYADIIGTDNPNYLHHYLSGARIDEVKIPTDYQFEKEQDIFLMLDRLCWTSTKVNVGM
ncbi:hypothetical protein KUH03_32780 [Sphingobacterium sp. E70]|uniref:hypothetical protein n=1 Tax=Sphingobacterium sp. E70 TaxID=2853439 RepID=UPI00211D10EA|nr:hypothetical protein [Sphingobacterium sp. E70]ULT23868.1 hypothetical protein KUH03_32780 [Sphingobacterium sp. E70]